jgi:hypothetical protein
VLRAGSFNAAEDIVGKLAFLIAHCRF